MASETLSIGEAFQSEIKNPVLVEISPSLHEQMLTYLDNNPDLDESLLFELALEHYFRWLNQER